jgi:hypothetical protein
VLLERREGVVWIRMVSGECRIVRKPWASPGLSSEYLWTIRWWLSSGQNARLMSDNSDPIPGAALFAWHRHIE